MSNVADRAQRFLGHLRDVWLIVGMTLALFLLIELSARALFFTKDLIAGTPMEGWCDRIKTADAYAEERWPDEYCAEHLLVGMEWHPYVYWRRRPIEGAHINVDENGHRRTYNRGSYDHCNGDPHRIFVLGGSTIWGPGVRDDYTVPSHLSRLVEDAGLCTEVTNLGEQGYVSTQELIYLMRKLQRGDVPALAVFYDGVNETFSAFQNQRAGLPQNEVNRRNEFNLLRDEDRLRNAFVTHAAMPEGIGRLGAAIWRRVQPAQGDFGVDPNQRRAQIEIADADALTEDIVAVYKANIDVIRMLARQYQFTPLFYWQPLIFTKATLSEYEQAWHDQASGQWREFLLAAYDGVARDRDLNALESFRNISGIFDEREEPYYLDAFHLTEDGNREVASAMLEDVVRRLRLIEAGRNEGLATTDHRTP